MTIMVVGSSHCRVHTHQQASAIILPICPSYFLRIYRRILKTLAFFYYCRWWGHSPPLHNLRVILLHFIIFWSFSSASSSFGHTPPLHHLLVILLRFIIFWSFSSTSSSFGHFPPLHHLLVILFYFIIFGRFSSTSSSLGLSPALHLCALLRYFIIFTATSIILRPLASTSLAQTNGARVRRSEGCAHAHVCCFALRYDSIMESDKWLRCVQSKLRRIPALYASYMGHRQSEALR
jgi:hypothetical protein